MAASQSAVRTQSPHFEDFRPGQRWTSSTRRITAEDLAAFAELSGDRHPLHTDPEWAARTRFGRPVLHGPFGIAVFLGFLHDMGLAGESVIALLDTNWRYLKPMYVGDSLQCTLTVTRCRRTSDPHQGVVHRHVVLENQRGEHVQEGTSAVLVRARGTGPDPASLAPGTVAWGSGVAELLARDKRFAEATATWDGAIGLRAGEHEVQLRVYLGRIIDVARRTPHGPTFTLAADEPTWIELLTGERNDLVARMMRGQFHATGDAYEYLRLTKVLHVITDAARELAQEARA